MKLKDDQRPTFGMIDKRVAVHAGNYDSKTQLDASNIIAVLTNLGANLNNVFATVGTGVNFATYSWDSQDESWISAVGNTFYNQQFEIVDGEIILISNTEPTEGSNAVILSKDLFTFLSEFVRYNIDQGLNESQKDTARLNTGGLARDKADTHTGTLTQDGKLTLNDPLAGGVSFTITRPGESGSNSFISFVNDSGAVFTINTSGTVRQNDTIVTSPFTGAITIRNIANDADVIILKTNGRIFQSRSSDATESIRRDESHLTFPGNTAGTGKLNNVGLTDGLGMIVFGEDVTEVSGIVSNNLDQKELIIWSDNPDGLILTEQDTDSDANNRLLRGSVVPYQTWIKLIYKGGIQKWVSALDVFDPTSINVFTQNSNNQVTSSGISKQTILDITTGSDALVPEDMEVNKSFTFTAEISTSSFVGSGDIDLFLSLGGQEHGALVIPFTAGDWYIIKGEFRLNFVAGIDTLREFYFIGSWAAYDNTGALVARKFQSVASNLIVDATSNKTFDVQVQADEGTIKMYESKLSRV